MKKTRMRAGIEIEMVYNPKIIGAIKYGAYHGDEVKKGKNWKVENDTSIHPSGDDGFNSYGYNRGECLHECTNECYDNDCLHECNNECGGNLNPCLEFISDVQKGKKGFFKAIEEFKTFFKSELNPLSEVLSFNKSCGCHIHIGLSDAKKKYNDKLDFKILKDTRDLYFKLINNSEILSENAKQDILKHYFREGCGHNYAKKLTSQIWEHGRGGREYEFNKNSEDGVINRGLEWRSFNLCGVKTWSEFDECFKIAWSCLEFLFKVRTNGYILKREIIKFQREDLNEQQNEKRIIPLKNDNSRLDYGLNSNKSIIEVKLS